MKFYWDRIQYEHENWFSESADLRGIITGYLFLTIFSDSNPTWFSLSSGNGLTNESI